MINNYECYWFNDYRGELLVGEWRSALSYWREPGYTQILFIQHTSKGDVYYDGYCLQSDKAGYVTRVWVEDGQISTNFKPDTDKRFGELQVKP